MLALKILRFKHMGMKVYLSQLWYQYLIMGIGYFIQFTKLELSYETVSWRMAYKWLLFKYNFFALKMVSYSHIKDRYMCGNASVIV